MIDLNQCLPNPFIPAFTTPTPESAALVKALIATIEKPAPKRKSRKTPIKR